MDVVLSFRSPSGFRKWLATNHRASAGIWLRIFKKASGEKSITYAEALDEALCFGWIDGQKHDALSLRQRFTRRRPKSSRSKINTRHADRLVAAKKMKAPGLAEINAAKKDGRWAAANDSQSMADVPQDFMRALRRNKMSLKFFESLSKANKYAIAYRLQTAKRRETHARRMERLLGMMKRGEKLH